MSTLNLNSEQEKAILTTETPLLVIAGAGSGKTKVITQKIIYLIKNLQLKPSSIMALTFTNKAADEMRSRIFDIIPRANCRGMSVSTFHTFGLKFLKTHAELAHRNANFTLFDNYDTIHLLETLAEDVGAISTANIKLIAGQISNWKNDMLSPVEAEKFITEKWHEQAIRLYQLYEKAQQDYNALDLDDLILLPLQILQQHQDIREIWQNKIRHLLVDEYQDTNKSQYHLIKCLVGTTGKFTCVGDDDQSIYAWRGANPQNIQTLTQDYPTLEVVKLEQNYRSSEIILRAANELIANNEHLFEKKLWSNNGPGDNIDIFAATDEHNEAESIVHRIFAKKCRLNAKYKDFAILYRSNHQARVIEQALQERSMPYQISGGTSFFANKEIKDLIAYFQLMLNPENDNAFLRCVNTPKREIGSTTLSKLCTYAKSRQTALYYAATEVGLSYYVDESTRQKLEKFARLIDNYKNLLADSNFDCIQEFVEEINYFEYISTNCTPQTAKRKQDNVKHLLKWLQRIIEQADNESFSCQDALNKILLIDLLDKQSKNQENDCIQLLTLHAAKGLEFNHVYIIGMEEEILPHKNSLDEDKLEEERRLAYVGITRAKETLTLSFCQTHIRYGETIGAIPSRFLEELPNDAINWENHPEKNSSSPPDNGAKKFAALQQILANAS